jgi:hypothetical protein
MTTKYIIICTIIAMTGIAVADQRPKLPPKPVPTKTFQARASMAETRDDRVVYMIAEKQCDLPHPEEVAALRASCAHLEKTYFAGVDAVAEDDAEDLRRCVESGAEELWCRRIILGPDDPDQVADAAGRE